MKVSDHEMQDEALITLVKHGDQNAFHDLFERHHANLFKLIHYRTNDYAQAQDIVQETFVRVWVNRENLRPDLVFFAYLVRIGQNLIQDHYKYQQVRTKHADHVKVISERTVSNPEQDMRLSRLTARIRDVAETDIPRKCRVVFALSRGAGLSNQEIADTLQISKKTVENQLHNALKVLRKKCEDYL